MTRESTDVEIITEQHPFKKLSFDFDLDARRKEFEKKMGGKKVDYEFQEIGLEMQKWFGKKVFWIFYKPEAELNKIKQAFKVCQEKGIKEVKYLLGVIKHLES